MTYGVKLHVWGEMACFTRPEMKVERVSYDVMTPSAARGILEAVHWKPAIRWVVDKIHILKPIKVQTIKRNEVSSVIPSRTVARAMASGNLAGLHLVADRDRTQRSATVLRDVAYVIEAHFEMTAEAGPDDNPGKHLDIFNRRADKGQCFHRPYFGTREFACDFRLFEGDVPQSDLPAHQRDQDLGWMLLDLDYKPDCIEPKFFRVRLDGHTIHVPPMHSIEVRA